MKAKETIFEKACKCENSGRPPVWMMRQAGRYLPEYRKVRKSHSFLTMIKTPEIATEITLQPIRRFGMDAAILFSDILVTAEALGSDLEYVEKVGPVIHNPTQTLEDIQNLDSSNIEEKLSYVTNAIKMLNIELKGFDIPLIGFAGAPFTVASYMVEGRSSKDIQTIKKLIGSEPETFHSLLDVLTETTIKYLNEQIKAGVKALQIFDTWACYLSWKDFDTFSLSYIKKIVTNLNNPNNIPVIVYTRNSHAYAPRLQNLPIQGLSLDWQCDLNEMRKVIRSDIALQGNLDPYLLLGDKHIIEKRVNEILSKMKNEQGFIFNLGHGLIPQINPDHVKFVVDLIKGN